MPKNKRKIDHIPEQFESFEALADFWDSHDLTDYDDQLQEVEVEIAAKPARHFVLSLSDELTQAMRSAIRAEGVSLETPVDHWTQERLQKY